MFFVVYCLWLFSITITSLADNRTITVIIPSYNNEKFYLKNLNTLFSQDYKNFRVIYIDDCSQDKTAELVEQYIQNNNLQEKIVLVKNHLRCGALRNIYMSIYRYCNDDDIVVIYDGDDWLATRRAFTIINQAYQNQNVWTTYGNFSSTRHGLADWCCPYESDVVKNRSYRKSFWRFGPLRTFYAWLFKQIQLKDLLYKGTFYPMAGDQAFVHPILEMADGRFKFIPHVVYIYNEHNPINDWSVNARLQHCLRDIILAGQPYKPLGQKPATANTLPSIYTIDISLDNQNRKQIVKNLISNSELSRHDLCLFVDTQISPMPKNILEHAQLLKQTNATLVTYARYENSANEHKEIRHCSYLWDTLFTSQLGWKPILLHPYTEYAWLIPTKICRENESYVCKLLEKHSSYRLNLGLAQKTGLLVITE